MRSIGEYGAVEAQEDARKLTEAAIRVASPAYVLAYDAGQQRADVKIPLVGVRHREDGRKVYADRSLEEWLTGGSRRVEMQSTRMHHLTDAVAFPMVRPFSDPILDVPTDRCRVGLPAPGARLEVTDAGKVRIGTDAAELIDLLHQLVKALKTCYTTTAAGPQPLMYIDAGGGASSIPTLASAIEALLVQIKE